MDMGSFCGESANGYADIGIRNQYLWHLRPQAPSVFMAFTTADSVSYWSSEADTR
jgi:hypothetical protein